jgi:hypothetical protein
VSVCLLACISMPAAQCQQQYLWQKLSWHACFCIAPACVVSVLCNYSLTSYVLCVVYLLSHRMHQLARSLTAPLEMVVATPNRLGKVMKEGGIALGEVRW